MAGQSKVMEGQKPPLPPPGYASGHSQPVGLELNGLVCLALCTRIRLRESCKTNQIAVLLINK